RTDGRPFADSISALTSDGQIYYPPRVDELGHEITSSTHILVATGTDTAGGRTASTSGDWASTSKPCTAGDALAATLSWTDGFTATGTEPTHLYCFGIDYAQPL